MILPITLTIAGAAAILNVWIASRVGNVRRSAGINVGDGSHPALVARMRAHSNFVEYTPFFLILLALIEMARGSQVWLWAVAILFIIGRIMHAFGMDRPAPNKLRMGGMFVTGLPLLGLALYAISIPYFTPPRADQLPLAPARAALEGGTKLN